MKKYCIYLDNCCFNRPYDDQTQAERFISLLLREPFDYTEWRKDNLFVGMSLDEIIDEADKYCKEN